MPNGKLLPHFLAVLNTDGDPDGLIRHGNERVLRARFNDARFFWETDQKIPLRQRVEMLKAVTFQKDLGSYFDKTMRVQKLGSLICRGDSQCRHAGAVGRRLQGGAACQDRPHHRTGEGVHRAAGNRRRLVRQGAATRSDTSARPRRRRSATPSTISTSRSRWTTAFRVPSKERCSPSPTRRTASPECLRWVCSRRDRKIPFALRRAANGIVKIIAEHKLPLPIGKLFSDARAEYVGSEAERRFSKEINFDEAIANFMRERLEFYLRDARGFAYDVVNAVLAAGSDDIVDAIARAEAVSEVRGSEDFASISVAFKRIKNILRQARETNKAIAAQLDESALTEDAEKRLAAEIPAIAAQVRELREQRRTTDRRSPRSAACGSRWMRSSTRSWSWSTTSTVRANRLALLRDLLSEFSTIADFSEIVTENTKASPERGERA